MKKWLHKIEVWVDKSIPYLVILLLLVIITEFAFHDEIHDYVWVVNAIDWTIIVIFIIDLSFKYYRLQVKKTFLKKYWLDVLAVFPFYLLFRAFESIAAFFRFSEELKKGQTLLHEGLELEKVGSKVVKEASEAGKIAGEAGKVTRASRFRFLPRVLRAIQRSPRLLRAKVFFEKPSGKHYKEELKTQKRKKSKNKSGKKKLRNSPKNKKKSSKK